MIEEKFLSAAVGTWRHMEVDMINVVLFLMALGGGSLVASAPVSATETAAVGAASPARVAEDQTVSGKFLTATETKPILTATKANWVAVREYNGQDLVYFTHLLAWRCGLYEISYAINGGPAQSWPMPDCHADGPSPNAITADDGLPYVSHALGSVQTIDVEILYDDLSTDSSSYARKAVLMP